MYARPLLPKLATVALLCLMSAACAQNRPYPEVKDNPTPSGDRLSYSIGFTAKGEPVVLGPDGKRLPPTRINFPIPGDNVKEVTRLVNFNAMEVTGSHYLVYCFGAGFCFCVDLPHPDNTIGNACSKLGR